MRNKFLLSSCLSAMLVFGANAFAVEDVVPADVPPAPQHQQFEGKKMHEMHQKKLAEDLGLTAEQQAKAEAIRKADFEKMKPLIEEMKALHEKMDNMRKENLEAFKEILTPEQKVKFENIIAQHKEKMGNAPKPYLGKPMGMDRRHKLHNQ
ncbi:MAG: hypothetical protein J6Y53_03670 [Alphaproteobacteria bacterium]|nr:hypothetical protein [Alphaproteobacteria bacterium]